MKRSGRGAKATAAKNREGNVRPCLLNRAVADKLGRMKLLDVMLSLIAAVATALLLGLIAHDELGMPIDEIRVDAVSAACVIFATVSFWSLLSRGKSRPSR